jgi:hypothetical protein
MPAKKSTKAKTGKTPKRATAEAIRDTCFIITPFGGWFDEYYEDIFRPAIEAAGLNATRADDLYRPGTIVNDIWKFAQDAKVILADLTHKNPNVFYELGLAHALAKPAILITESIDDVPFDLRSLRVLQYDKNRSDWGEQLKEDISKAIDEVLKSPIEAVLPTFLSVKIQTKPPKVTAEDKAIMQLRQEMDALRREVMSVRHAGKEERIGPSEAEARIREYLRNGMPQRAIVRRLVTLGAPESWVIDKIIEEEKGGSRQHELPMQGRPPQGEAK